jgi:hypothetical protein
MGHSCASVTGDGHGPLLRVQYPSPYPRAINDLCDNWCNHPRKSPHVAAQSIRTTMAATTMLLGALHSHAVVTYRNPSYVHTFTHKPTPLL